MLWVGFEPRIPELEWKKTVHALDRAATVIDNEQITFQETVILINIIWKNIVKYSLFIFII
jgi:hypothetical protein